MKTRISLFVSRIKKRFCVQKKYGCLYLEKPSGPRIHIGCGKIEIPGWINIDARAFPHVHIVTDSVDLKEFSAGTVQEIYLCHVLEHFSFDDVDILLKIYHSKLMPDGVLRLSVPDFELLIKIYEEADYNLELIRAALMGGQNYPQNYHKSVFDKKLLEGLLLRAGFSQVMEWETEKDFGKDLGDWSSGMISKGLRSFEISLNLKAIK